MPATRLSRGLVALAASAISAVYVAGYFHTQSADEGLSAAPVAAAVPADSPTDAPTLSLTSGVAATPAASATSFVITDGQVEQYANAQHITWDAARAQLEVAGGVEPTPAADQASPQIAAAATPATSAEGSAVDARPAAAQAAAGAASGSSRQASNPTPTVAPRVVATARPTQAPTSAPTAVARAATASGFKDGTFTGAGNSPRGGIQVSLAVQSGRITSVTITRATTEYPTRDIAALPSQVVSRQSAQVDTVSGATYSTQAFRGAVQQALNQAKG